MSELTRGFQPLPIPHMMLVNKNDRLYRIYQSEGDYTPIEALSVKEALEKSGIHNPKQIIPANMFIGYMLTESEVSPDSKNNTP